MSEYYDFALDLVRKAGEMVLEERTKPFSVSTKGQDPRDLITEIDIKINNFLISEIKQRYPDHSIYSEEGGDVETNSGFMWALDPIDGTANFSRNIPHFAVSIGLLKDGEPEAGAVLNPVTGELFSFEKGKGAFFNGEEIKVSDIKEMKDSYVLLSGYRHKEVKEWGHNLYKNFVGGAKKTKNLGSTSLDISFLAAGRVDVVIYGRLAPLDNVASFGILKEAGGYVLKPNGDEVPMNREHQRIVAVNSMGLFESIKSIVDN